MDAADGQVDGDERLAHVDRQQVRIDAADEHVDRVVAPRPLRRVRRQVDAEPEPLREAEHGQSPDLSACTAEHALGDPVEQSGSHRELHELVCGHHGAVRLHPTSQQFGTDDHAGAGIELGLEERDDVAVVDRPSQSQLEIDPLAVLASQFGVEMSDPAAAGCLCLVERDVRVGQHLADVGAVRRSVRDPDADRRWQLATRGVDRLAEHTLQLMGNSDALLCSSAPGRATMNSSPPMRPATPFALMQRSIRSATIRRK